MNDVDNNGFNQSMNKKSAFLRFMRYVAVAGVTVFLIVFMISSTDTDDFTVAVCVAGLILLAGFFITIPIIVFWIYSFLKSIERKTKTDRILLWFHIVDLFLIGVIAFLLTRPPLKCDANIMVQNYKGENGFWMRNIAHRYRNMLPDSTRLCVEIDNDYASQSRVLSEQVIKKLERELRDCGCVGIDVDNNTNRGYATIRFRRIGMGMYSYRFYDRPLTLHEQDSINNDGCLIVYNDTTVFEFSAGVLGAQRFVGKEEFIKSFSK